MIPDKHDAVPCCCLYWFNCTYFEDVVAEPAPGQGAVGAVDNELDFSENSNDNQTEVRGHWMRLKSVDAFKTDQGPILRSNLFL